MTRATVRTLSPRQLFDALSALPQDEAYRGYLIRSTLLGQLFIEKDGFTIARSIASVDDAKATINLLHG